MGNCSFFRLYSLTVIILQYTYSKFKYYNSFKFMAVPLRFFFSPCRFSCISRTIRFFFVLLWSMYDCHYKPNEPVWYFILLALDCPMIRFAILVTYKRRNRLWFAQVHLDIHGLEFCIQINCVHMLGFCEAVFLDKYREKDKSETDQLKVFVCD